MRKLLFVCICFAAVEGFVGPLSTGKWRDSLGEIDHVGATALFAEPARAPQSSNTKVKRARELIRCLIEEDKCYTTESGAKQFADVCASNVVIADCFFPQPFNGKSEALTYMLERVAQRKEKSNVRIDKISDGDKACGFAWTWTCGDEEGLRGTTFVELNDSGEIQYLQEIPEPIYKPGDLTKQLLEAITQGFEPKPPVPYEKRRPTRACEVAEYLFVDLNKAEPVEATNELMTFFDDNVIYRDFNFEEVLRGPTEVRQFVDDFNFPGIEFRPIRFDDGDVSTCFTWEIAIADAPDTIKGISFYELDPETRKIIYVRDVPESAIKPPILGTWARNLRPGLGVFQPVPIGSRPNGM
uniref:SnoaL-like domain-containing protein n=1 Tax=Entomoneis paludosa TaxID=265537 RepID=A0A7S3DWL9_9STRA|mmetsp:Transcript_6748/g.14107  ORF Transcript_6748/g.14107 Transcript_6748/m.14107 type:complete len:355 (+) Transcript_6748:67-1131(+)